MGRNARKSSFVTQSLADRLSELLAEKKDGGFSLRDVSEGCKIASSSLSEWASDYKTPTLENIVVLAKYFGVSTDYLLGLTNIPTANVELRSICEYTGLPIDAIQRLNKAKEIDDNNFSVFLGQALSNHPLNEFLRRLYEYSLSVDVECIASKTWGETYYEEEKKLNGDINFKGNELDADALIGERTSEQFDKKIALLLDNEELSSPVKDLLRIRQKFYHGDRDEILDDLFFGINMTDIYKQKLTEAFNLLITEQEEKITEAEK